jgi:disulfide oxidoreductase YuzD
MYRIYDKVQSLRGVHTGWVAKIDATDYFYPHVIADADVEEEAVPRAKMKPRTEAGEFLRETW